MEWGDNEYGQMGNKKRSGNLTPIVLKDFSGKKIKGVFAGDNKSGVIIEREDWMNELIEWFFVYYIATIHECIKLTEQTLNKKSSFA